jgi:hypothetical protein
MTGRRVRAISGLCGPWSVLDGPVRLPMGVLEAFVTPHSRPAAEPRHDCGYGFWLRSDRPIVLLEGAEAGVAYRSVYGRPCGLTYTVVCNTSSRAWPLARRLGDRPRALGDG